MLTDRQCRNAKPKVKPYKLYDSKGLYLLVKPNGSKLWQMKYRLDGKEKVYSIGMYDDRPSGVSLAEARTERDEAQALIRQGRDPVIARRISRMTKVTERTMALEPVCNEWLEKRKSGWSAKHHSNVASLFERYVYPALGKIPVAEVTRAMIMRLVLEPLDKRGVQEVPRRLRQELSAAFRYASAQSYVPEGYDPAGKSLLEGLSPQRPVRHQPAITDIRELRELMQKVDEGPCHPTTKLATRFIAVTAVRVRTMMEARWDQFVGLEGLLPIWEIPGPFMKGEKDQPRPFTVPLCTQAVDVLSAARMINGRFDLVFPNDIRPELAPISNNAVLFNLYRLGYRSRHTAHGFRASLSTILNERDPKMRGVIDFMLGHVPPNTVEAAYNRALYLEERRKLHQEYADLLLEGFPSAVTLLDLPRR
jgi:integrase